MLEGVKLREEAVRTAFPRVVSFKRHDFPDDSVAYEPVNLAFRADPGYLFGHDVLHHFNSDLGCIGCEIATYGVAVFVNAVTVPETGPLVPYKRLLDEGYRYDRISYPTRLYEESEQLYQLHRGSGIQNQLALWMAWGYDVARKIHGHPYLASTTFEHIQLICKTLFVEERRPDNIHVHVDQDYLVTINDGKHYHVEAM